ncbi:MAG: type II toxin-antitoxin system VapC family toxin [Luteolibacter sp.]
MFLIDTNVICEIRKGDRANPAVRAWFLHHAAQAHYLSVLTVGEIRRGVELIRAKDPAQAAILERSLAEIIAIFDGRILEIGLDESEIWGRLCLQERLPDVDGMMAATAISRGLVVVTRNTKDFVRSGVEVVNPWEFME